MANYSSKSVHESEILHAYLLTCVYLLSTTQPGVVVNLQTYYTNARFISKAGVSYEISSPATVFK